MKPELSYLTWVTCLTGVMWMPYVVDRLKARGMLDAAGYPTDPKPPSAWSQRLMRAHMNAVENLAIFATLVVVAQLAGVGGPQMLAACQIYFWARLAHAVGCVFAIPWAPTLAFTVAFGAQVVIALELLRAT
ncbi:MAPEG family protein [Pelomonas sp. KK5]|uniref:MAPEG family protein n=1 Tax=Pelomonas sp. KK5 TaxID=1855730 RepID=UPI00097BB330|nr:MAPEG family protein [Pelomonas sp. KK5]